MFSKKFISCIVLMVVMVSCVAYAAPDPTADKTVPVMVSIYPNVLSDGSAVWYARIHNRSAKDVSGVINVVEPTNLAYSWEFDLKAKEDILQKIEENITDSVKEIKMQITAGKKEYEILCTIDYCIAAKAKKPIVADGEFDADEWTGNWIDLNDGKFYKSGNNESWGGKSDISAKAQFMWDENNFYVAVEAEDDNYSREQNVDMAWKDDCIQFCIDENRQLEVPAKQYIEALICGDKTGTGAVEGFKFACPKGIVSGAFDTKELSSCKIIRNDTTTAYEIAIPWKSLMSSEAKVIPNGILGLSLLVNDSDSGKREGWLEFGSGIGTIKDAALFKDMVLSDPTVTANEKSPSEIQEDTLPPKDGSIRVMIDGKLQKYEQPPVLLDDRTMVPLRGIFETLGAKVDWDSSSNSAIAVKDDTTLKVTLDSKVAYINGETKKLEVAATLINDKTMVPLRFVSEAFGSAVEWDEANELVKIVTK